MFVSNIKILYYDRIEVFGGIDVDKTSASKEPNICHYWYFLGKEFKVQQSVCNWCHDASLMFINPKNIAILNICSIDYRCIISKSEAVNLLQNAHLSKKVDNYNSKKKRKCI